jgi:thiol:disulfide interchange protein DsbD
MKNFSVKKIYFLATLLLLMLGQRTLAQTDTAQKAVSWEFTTQMIGGQPALVLHAHILDGWKLYSTTMPDSLPNSRVTLDSSAKAVITGIDEQGKLQSSNDPLFSNALTRYFVHDAQWVVGLRSMGSAVADLKGTVTFMAIYKDSVVGPLAVPFRYEFAPDGSLVARSTALKEYSAGRLKMGTVDLANPVNKCGGTGAENSKSKGLLGIFFLGFLGGLVGLIMPCTFPMIPLTVSFFTKRAASRSKGIANAFLYGFFIFLIYTLISVPFYFLKANNTNILNSISTNVWLNTAFALVFLLFALSFFGLFEISLPSSISNTVDSKSNISSIGGIFFMALTLAIVSFSCTGPVLGAFVGTTFNSNSGPIELTAVLAGFGLALGLPFALFALFPGWLQSLPRSGGWMNTVKIVFGFIELALAIKYLSNADLVSHWGILKRETFFGIWIAIGACIVLFLLGILKFPHDPPPVKLSNGRKAFALFFFLIVVYLLPGLSHTRYANLSLVSGFPPPLSYSLYGVNSGAGGVEANVTNDFDKALQLAKEQHKPILIDFTGWACVNCRKMEENVWSTPVVRGLINDNYILVSLYVDDRKLLPDDQQFLATTSDGSKKAIRTIGDKFATLQSENFSNASQPFYVVLSPDQRLLSFPVGYTPDPRVYAEWLRCGLDAYKTSTEKTAAR